jgi:hypothetical protein
MLSQIRQDKKLLFGLLGFGSGALGGLVAEITGPDQKGTYVISLISVALWAALAAMVIAIGLYWAINVYSHRKTDWPVLLKKAIPAGLVAGAISGSVAQAIFGLLQFQSGSLMQLTFQAGCWGIMGCLLGLALSFSIRNLGALKAIIAGAIGSFIGGFGFLLSGIFIPATLGRMFGIGILGAALGLSLIIVEERYRSAYLEVHWAPNESSKFTLGSRPISIGGGSEDDIFVYGIPHHAMSLWLERGKLKGIYHVTGEHKELHDGSPIKFGKIEMIVRIIQSQR